MQSFHIPLSHIDDSRHEGSGASRHLTSWECSEFNATTESLRRLLSDTLVSEARLQPGVDATLQGQAGVLCGDRGRTISVKVLEKAWGTGCSGYEQVCSASQVGSYLHNVLLSGL